MPEVPDAWRKTEVYFAGAVTIFTLVLAVVSIAQWCQMVTANQNATKALQITQRAYVSLGSKSGKLAEFGNGEKGKRIVIVHLVNSGLSTARHLVVHFATEAPHGFTFGFHRHRFRSPGGGIMTSNSGIEIDLAGGAEHIEYLTEPTSLIGEEATNPRGLFEVHGEIEYCDIFGGYHCDQFSVRYMPSPIADFTAGFRFKCAIEKPDERAFHGVEDGKPATFTEIEPCEQPDEPEYQRETDWKLTAPTPAAKSTPGA